MENKGSKLFTRTVLRYFAEGLIIAIVAYYVPIYFKSSLRKPTIGEIVSIASTASMTMLILDYFSPYTGVGTRFGVGFASGSKIAA